MSNASLYHGTRAPVVDVPAAGSMSGCRVQERAGSARHLSHVAFIGTNVLPNAVNPVTEAEP